MLLIPLNEVESSLHIRFGKLWEGIGGREPGIRERIATLTVR